MAGKKHPRVIVSCPHCGKQDEVTEARARTYRACSRLCHVRGAISKNASLTCAKCGTVKRIPLSRALAEKYCSPACAGNAPSRVEIACDECGKMTARKPSVRKRVKKAYCSKECYLVGLSDRLRGSNAPNWQGGVSGVRKRVDSSVEARAWRTAVLTRDQRTCQGCGVARKKGLHAHHIKPVAEYPESMFDVDNGITLCDSCHELLHKQQGPIRGRGRLLRYLEENGWDMGTYAAERAPRPCVQCKTMFAPRGGSRHVYCSGACRELAQHRRAHLSRGIHLLPERQCKYCRTTFKPGRATQAVCAPECEQAHVSRISLLPEEDRHIPCAFCGQQFQRKAIDHRFCRRACKVAFAAERQSAHRASRKAHTQDAL
jgi:hypothetical protein